MALAKAFDARLTGLHVEADPEVAPGTAVGRLNRAVELIASSNASIARRSHEAFVSALRSSNLRHQWLSAKGDVTQNIIGWSRYADLVIIGQYESQGEPLHHPLPVCHRVSIKSGRPILVLPGSEEAVAAFARILIAWDGSREAVRAVHDAMPFLMRAERTDVIVVRPDIEHLASDVADPKWLSAHLRNRGVTVGDWKIADEPEPIAKSIERAVSDGTFDLLVMGAYSRPDWYEFIAGGTTQSLLLSSPIPLLISH